MAAAAAVVKKVPLKTRCSSTFLDVAELQQTLPKSRYPNNCHCLTSSMSQECSSCCRKASSLVTDGQTAAMLKK